MVKIAKNACSTSIQNQDIYNHRKENDRVVFEERRKFSSGRIIVRNCIVDIDMNSNILTKTRLFM